MAKRTPRPLVPFGNVVLVTLTRGHTAIVDLTDREVVAGRSWHSMPAKRTVYAISGVPGMNTTEGMHRVIMGLDRGDPRQVDHINHCGLDNRRANLRVVSPYLNQVYAQKRAGATSRYKGVSYDQGQWVARINIDGATKGLGRFKDERDAALAYDAAAARAWGDHAYLNLPLG